MNYVCENSQIPFPDSAFAQVRDFLSAKPDLLGTVGRAIRKSFDEVIDGPRTGRFRIEQLEKTEKTYIGTKVEIVLRAELELQRGHVLDNLILGHEVDTKFTVGNTWMIPSEASCQLCLLVTGDDNTGLCGIGLLRATPEVLTNSENRDGKKSVSAFGKKQIAWLATGPMPRNFLLGLPDQVREHIMCQPSGMQRVSALFQSVTGRIIPRSAIEQVAQQKDPMRRARQMKDRLAAAGFQVLCATYDVDRVEFRRHGFHEFGNDDWLSVRI